MWILLYVIERVLASTCPVTVKTIGPVIGVIEIVATIVFMVLTFFFSSHWWYGLIAVAIYFVVPFITPRIDTCIIGDGLRLYSFVGSVLRPILIILMYLSLFNVI